MSKLKELFRFALFALGVVVFAFGAGAADLKIDFTRSMGAIKPVHGVNNGPVRPMPGAKQDEFRAAGIPFMRTHDTHSMWGGSHYVDVPNIFPNFDADENDPNSYDYLRCVATRCKHRRA